MRTEGKSIREIVEYLEKTYKIKTYAGAVAKAVGDVKKNMVATEVKRPSRKYKTISADVASTDNMIKDIVTLLAEIKSGYGQVFKFLRTELIKSRAEVCLMLTGAGIVPPKSEVTE